MIYAKLSKISYYTIKEQELGKIINLLSNDFNVFEAKGPTIFIIFVIPFAMVGIVAILFYRFRIAGLSIPAVILFFLPFQILVGKMNGSLFQQINVNKDKRVKMVN